MIMLSWSRQNDFALPFKNEGSRNETELHYLTLDDDSYPQAVSN